MVNHRDEGLQSDGMERLKPLLAVQYFSKELELGMDRDNNRGVGR